MSRLNLSIVATALMFVCGCANNSQPRVQKEVPAPMAPPVVPPAKNENLDVSLRDQAKREIRLDAQSKDPRIRSNAIETIQNVLGNEGHDLVAAGLSDRDPNVRFAAEMAAGKLKFADLHDQLLRLASDPNLRVQIGARFALHRLGDTHLSHDLEKFARDPNSHVRADTAFVLGLMEEPSAIKILRQMLIDSDSDVRIQVAESLWRLHDPQPDEALNILVAGMVSQFADDQMICLIALAGPRDSRAEGYIRGKLTDPYVEVQLVAARAMGELGKDDGYAIAIKSIKSTDPRQRSLAAIALGAIGRSDAQDELTLLLKDSEVGVRLAAAQAILQLKNA